jgi:adenylate cyclase
LTSFACSTTRPSSCLESTGEAGKIQVAPATRELLAGRFELAERGIIEVRGKGPMQTCFLIGRKPAAIKGKGSPSIRIDRE